MKTVVSLQELLESQVRPADLLAEYLDLMREDIAERWPTTAALRQVDCQACGTAERKRAFVKYGLTYCQCTDCGSLYVSPRPTADELRAYYRDSAASRFWRDEILPTTAQARKEKIARPRAQWVADGIAEYCPQASIGRDLSPAGSTLGQELLGEPTRSSYAFSELPLDVGAIALRVVQSDAGECAELVDVVAAFDVVDRSADVRDTIDSIAGDLREGGLLFATATSITGFDLQVLWDRSPTLTPPDKLNALSMRGLRQLFGAPRWELLELSTPGMFDSENVRRAAQSAPEDSWPRVIQSLVRELDEHGWRDLQGFLQQHRLGSFARVIARRLE